MLLFGPQRHAGAAAAATRSRSASRVEKKKKQRAEKKWNALATRGKTFEWIKRNFFQSEQIKRSVTAPFVFFRATMRNKTAEKKDEKIR